MREILFLKASTQFIAFSTNKLYIREATANNTDQYVMYILYENKEKKRESCKYTQELFK